VLLESFNDIGVIKHSKRNEKVPRVATRKNNSILKPAEPGMEARLASEQGQNRMVVRCCHYKVDIHENPYQPTLAPSVPLLYALSIRLLPIHKTVTFILNKIKALCQE
jgi:hypothetical protein